MSSRTMKIIVTLSFLVLTQTASAQILWDQSTLDLMSPGIANSDSPGFGGFTIHTVGDVAVTGDGWMVESITQYYSSWNYDWINAITQGYLHVFPKTGPLPAEDPSQSAIVPMSAVSFSPDVIAVTASGLSLGLEPGEYWIGITPMAPAGMFGANLQFATSVVGDEAATYDMMIPGWGNNYVGYDGAMLIAGEPAVPNATSSWGQIKSNYR